MLPRHHPGRVQITFGGHRLAANAGLILPATLALRLGLPQLLRKRLRKRLGSASTWAMRRAGPTPATS